MTAAPIILTAMLAPGDQAWVEALRRAHYPPERNQVPAHVSLFQHLPPSIEPELRQRLRDVARRPALTGSIDRVIDLDGAVALHLLAPELLTIREALAEVFAGCLIPQDRVTPRLHITVQNKVSAAQARSLYATLTQTFVPRPVGITGLAAWRYIGGPWQPIAQVAFRG